MLDFDDTLSPLATTTHRSAADAPPRAASALARAARHDILRRLAPPLRHDMVVHLQSVGLLAETLTARLDRGLTAPHDLQAALSKLNRLSRQAVTNCLQVAGWMAHADDDTIALRDAVQECARLLATSLDFRGLALRVEAGDALIDVARPAARFLLAAAVITLADDADAPGDLVVRAHATSTHGVATIDYVRQPDPGFGALHEPVDAPLDWTEVQALAAEHGVQVQREPQSIVLRLPRVQVTSPLKMVPI
ncbi:MAG: hypothetical protein EOO24_26215 [Comamonadaceae bacterium]|nr:MAG: hypothetical protein EOO24_26215 [Comamonadaceae bacterium]